MSETVESRWWNDPRFTGPVVAAIIASIVTAIIGPMILREKAPSIVKDEVQKQIRSVEPIFGKANTHDQATLPNQEILSRDIHFSGGLVYVSASGSASLKKVEIVDGKEVENSEALIGVDVYIDERVVGSMLLYDMVPNTHVPLIPLTCTINSVQEGTRRVSLKTRAKTWVDRNDHFTLIKMEFVKP